MDQVTVTLVFASIAEAAAALGAMGKSQVVTTVTVADTKPTASPTAAPEKKAEPSAAAPKAVAAETQATPVDPSALATALQSFAKRDNAAFGALMKKHGLKNMAAVTEAKPLHAELMAAVTTA